MYADIGDVDVAENEYEVRRGEDGYVSSPYRLLNPRADLELPVGCLIDDINLRDAGVVGMTGVEEDMLGNPKSKDPMIRLIAGCTVKLGGLEVPYEDRTQEQRQDMLAMVRRLTISDMSFLLIAIRRVSFVDGDTYRFPVTCPNRGCQQRRMIHELDLGELTVRPAPSSQRRQFEFTMPVSKRVVRYQMLQATDIDRLITLRRQHTESAASAALYARIIDVDGKKLGSYDDTKRWSSADRDALSGAIRDSDQFGVDMRVQVDDCPSCGNTMEVTIDVTPSFFRPTLTR